MPEIWEISVKRFIGNYPVKDPATSGAALADDLQLEREIMEGTEGWLPHKMRRVSSCKGYFIAEVVGGEDVALISYDPYEDEYEVCGGYVGPSLWVRHSSRGKGLSAELVAAKGELVGTSLNPESYTTAGLAAHRAGHRLAVARALADGFRVPQEVLADYPELSIPRRAPRQKTAQTSSALALEPMGMR